MKIAHSICPSCSVGCGVNLIIKNQEAVGTYPYKRHPVNQGKNCKKGRDSFRILNEKRLKNPLMRKGGLQQVNWDEALDVASSQMKSYSAHEIGIITSGSLTNQEYETLKRLAASMGVENIGYNAGNFHSFDFETANLDDVENSSTTLIIGDVLKENPLLGRRVILAHENGAEIITVDLASATLTGINSDEYLQLDSISELSAELDKLLPKLNESSTVLIKELETVVEFENILPKLRESGAKILPVLEECNSRGAMNHLPALSKDDLKEILEKVKLLYVVGDDPASYLNESMKNLEFLITQDYLLTETVLMSDVVLPGSSWAEKSGSLTSTTGQTQEISKIVESPGKARDDETIMIELAKKMGLD
ncbi:MAG TPA: molybdopterin-dependent oxidoreductase [Methanobacterium subterraneum]|uniref:Molybdopterin-dependent oxidoreductase n=1 Tax=Methanobacterium subterraneum TaxID=59277 RepID=A0A7J4THW1_9EURY|nr:molybdopterin-dependent oxidoreductase [Methanobacterium subterraneum]